MKILNTVKSPVFLHKNHQNTEQKQVKQKNVSLTGYADFRTHAAQNIAFHGLFDIKLEEKINAAANRLDDESILLVGPSSKTCINLLKRNTADIQKPFKNIYFVQNKNPENNNEYAIFKNDDKFMLFKLDILDDVYVLKGGKDRYSSSVNTKYADNDPKKSIEVKNGYYISWGPSDKIENIKFNPKYKMADSIFKKNVETFSYFDNFENIKSFNDNTLIKISRGKNDTGIKKVTFKDVGGQDEVVAKLEENVIFPLLYPEFYEDYRLNRGILLFGPPRCGKTLMALALANEANANFIKLGADDLTRSYVGQTEENWRSIFKEARTKQPTILFIDEFDAIAKKRSGSDTARHQDNVVNQILVLMSDLEKSNDQVFVIAATNRKDLIDNAMLDSGRFGLSLEVKEPDLEGTKQIFRIHKNNKKLSEDVDENKLAKLMHENHFNGSNIAEIFTIAHSKAMNRLGLHEKMRKKIISKQDILNFSLTNEDLIAAINDIIIQKKKEISRTVIKGFNTEK